MVGKKKQKKRKKESTSEQTRLARMDSSTQMIVEKSTMEQVCTHNTIGRFEMPSHFPYGWIVEKKSVSEPVGVIN
jgi:hypothetical protein